MALTKQAPLLGLPLELRIRIYDILFSDYYISLEIECTEPETGGTVDIGRLSHSVSIDDGITLTCQQLRAETMAYLNKVVGLRCSLPPSPVKITSASLCGKLMYLEVIRRIHIVVSDDMWTFPFKAFTKLEEVHIEAVDSSLDPLCAAADEEQVRELARNRDFRSLVKLFADAVKGLDLTQATIDMLRDKDRGFRVIWKDRYVGVSNARSPRWIAFDWDTLEISKETGDLEADATELVLEQERQTSDD